LTGADSFDIDFEVAGPNALVKLLCNRQEPRRAMAFAAGKTDVANLPAGEIYFGLPAREGG